MIPLFLYLDEEASPVTLDSYQRQARRFACYHNDDLPPLLTSYYPFFGLAEEAGEVAGKIAKGLRKGRPADREALKKELGDVLWMLSACCDELGTSLEEVAQMNIEKLSDRQKAGTIVGEGDDR